ncbi:endolytic transglycosylase MltG [Candidatus Nomurabacteria bacterium]|nr:endolytic transglycosylase MltG [Candidatus Nomurabacteria bacterium]
MFSKTLVRTLTFLVAILVFAATIGFGFTLGFKYVISQNDRFERFEDTVKVIDKDNPDAVMIVIRQGFNTSDIADALLEAGVIKNKLAYVFMSKLNGFDGEYLAGTHFVKKDLNYDEIMYLLCLKPQTVRVTFREGLSYKEMKETLLDAGVLFDETVLDGLVNNPALFLEYDFVTEIPQVEGREWMLQGYLFPDTYDFDMNTTEESIIRTFLNNTSRKLIPELYKRAETMGMTMDEVITLASVIEKESGRLDEIDLVASVFHNRLNASKHSTGNRLESCATINYVKAERGQEASLIVTAEDQAMETPYNTYKYSGLPAGPICSPGMDAIRATLWPAKTGYFYFVTKNDDTGSSAFAVTEREHINNSNKYLAKK